MNTIARTFGNYDRSAEIARIEAEWATNPRWYGINRAYSAEDVVRLRGSINRDNTIANLGATKLWELLASAKTSPAFINAQGAQTGGQAVQQVNAGAQALYLSGGQTTVAHVGAETLHPDQSLYAINSVPSLVRRINNAFERADQIQWKAGATASAAEFIDYFAPIVADAEAHTGGAFNAYELTRNTIRAGAAGIHFDDRLDSAQQRQNSADQHFSDTQTTPKVLAPTHDVVQKLSAARLAADVEDVPTLIIAHTTANTAALLSADDDPYDRPFLTGERTEEGFYYVRAGIDQAIARGVAYAPYADLLWFESAQPELESARAFATAIRREYPDQLLAYNCASTGNLNATETAQFQRELAALGYRFQFIAQTAILNPQNAGQEKIAA